MGSWWSGFPDIYGQMDMKRPRRVDGASTCFREYDDFVLSKIHSNASIAYTQRLSATRQASWLRGAKLSTFTMKPVQVVSCHQ